MDEQKVRKILSYLSKATYEKQLAWKEGSDGNFRVDFGSSSILVGYKTRNPMDVSSIHKVLAGGDKSPAYGGYVSIFNSDGIEIVRIDESNMDLFDVDLAILHELYSEAKNMVYKYDETFDEILDELGGRSS